MKFPLYLALRNLLRHPGRNLLYILGVSITAALLLDMTLLSGGIRVSLQRVLKQMGYEIRLSPRGTLPFETDAQINGFSTIQSRVEKMPEVDHVDALLGTTIAVNAKGQTFTSFALGAKMQSLISERIAPLPARSVAINQYLAKAKDIHPGQHIQIWFPGNAQALDTIEPQIVRVDRVLSFELDAEGQYTIFFPLQMLQELMGQRQQDPVSVIMVKLKDSTAAPRINEQLNKEFPQITAYTISSVIDAVDKQLSYFKQFAYILGGISLAVTFVLVFIITTISFHDRLGEIALLRAIGLSNRTLFITILFEGILTSLASAVFGFILGRFVADWLDWILKSAPGLPENFSFFVMEPSSFIRAGIVLLATGFFAGLYPASAAARLPVAETLREEIL